VIQPAPRSMTSAGVVDQEVQRPAVERRESMNTGRNTVAGTLRDAVEHEHKFVSQDRGLSPVHRAMLILRCCLWYSARLCSGSWRTCGA